MSSQFILRVDRLVIRVIVTDLNPLYVMNTQYLITCTLWPCMHAGHRYHLLASQARLTSAAYNSLIMIRHTSLFHHRL